MYDDINTGIIVGAAGGATAGMILWMINRLQEHELEFRERRRIFRCLNQVTSAPDAKKWRSTRAIASYTNLPEDRVRYLCSRHPEIVLSTAEGEKEMWGILGKARSEEQTGV